VAKSVRYAISFSAVVALLSAVVGIRRRHAAVEVSDDAVLIRMGWAFSARIPRASITNATPHPRIRYAVGVHVVGRGSWIVNGTTRNIVELRIDPPAPARALGFPVRLRRVRVSVEQPAELVAAISDRSR
jgi:hypothetical protein